MRKKLIKRFAFAALVPGIMLMASESMADPFSIMAQLTGDPRPENPDDLIVDVIVNGDTTSDTTFWTVDINSPAHPNIKLDAFFFNLGVDASVVNFTNFDPATWSVSSPANNAQGSGSADFNFEADSSNPATDVTNSQDLTFEAVRTFGATWSVDDFLVASFSTSSDSALGSFQVGAHLQSLTAGMGQGDSGFAVGDWGVDGEPPSDAIPEPMTMLLFGVGIAGLSGWRMRKKL